MSDRYAIKPKIQVYLSSDTKPGTALKLLKATSEVRAKATQPLDPFTRTFLAAVDESAKVEAKLAQGTGLFFTLAENDTLLSVKRAAERLGCEYEFVDLRTGSLIDLDIKGIRIIGQRKIDASEFNMPTPCLKVGDAILEFSKRILGSDKIVEFYSMTLVEI